MNCPPEELQLTPLKMLQRFPWEMIAQSIYSISTKKGKLDNEVKSPFVIILMKKISSLAPYSPFVGII